MARPGFMSHWKYKLLVRLLGVGRATARGLVELLWEMANESGNPVLESPSAIEAAAEWEGEPGKFFAAMRDCSLVDEREDGRWEIHDYWHHAPEYVKGRKRKEEQRIREREGRFSDCHGTVTAAAVTVTGQSRDSHRIGCDVRATPSPSPSPLDSPLPPALDTESFRNAWQEWRTYRREIKKTMTARTEAAQLKKLESWGVERAVAAITHSIAEGYQGLYEGNGNANRKGGVGGNPSRVEAADDKYSNVAVKAVGDLEARLGGQAATPDDDPAEASPYPAHSVGSDPPDF